MKLTTGGRPIAHVDAAVMGSRENGDWAPPRLESQIISLRNGASSDQGRIAAIVDMDIRPSSGRRHDMS
jgi:hypothetical protein